VVLVNEFGKVGIDGAIFSAAGATVKEIAGGCLCCALSVYFCGSSSWVIE
jgi:G3E family GTPase